MFDRLGLEALISLYGRGRNTVACREQKGENKTKLGGIDADHNDR